MATKTPTTETVDILEVHRGRIEFYVLGQSPLICNSMSAKTKSELLFPSGRKSAAQKASTMKHDPQREFQDSIYRFMDDDADTLIGMPATSFKKACMGTCLDLPGAKKAQIGRLMYVVGNMVPIYGTPEIMLSVVRSADINKTPDVRTRAVLPAWCSKFIIEFTEPMLKAAVISRLLGAAGMMQGVGDWRVEKGSGDFGRFEVVSADHPQVKLLMETGDRSAQLEAMENPQPYDSESEQLLRFHAEEMVRRGFTKQAA